MELAQWARLFIHLVKGVVFMELVIMVNFVVSELVEAYLVIAVIVSFLKVVEVANLYFTVVDVALVDA